MHLHLLALCLFAAAAMGAGCSHDPVPAACFSIPVWDALPMESMSPEAGAAFGSWIVAGDLDSDAFPDLAVGAPHETVQGMPDAGAVYCFLAAGLGFTLPERVTVPASAGGPAAGDQFSSNRTGIAIGQLDGTGPEELLVGAPNRDLAAGPAFFEDIGSVYVFSWDGSAMQLENVLLPPHDDPASIPEGNGQRLGTSITVADVNADGFGDVIAGAFGVQQAYVYFGGPDLAAIDQTPGGTVTLRALSHKVAGDFGKTVAAGNLDSDGFADVAIGEELWTDSLSKLQLGRVTVFDGRFLVPGSIVPDDCTGACAQALVAEKAIPYMRYGEHLSSQDFDGDGLDDLSVFVEASTCFPGSTVGNAANFLYKSSGMAGQWFSLIPDRMLCAPEEGATRFGRNVVAVDWDGNSAPDAAVNEVLWADPDSCGAGAPCSEAGRVHLFPDVLGVARGPLVTFTNPDPQCDCAAQPPVGEQFGVGLLAINLLGDGRPGLIVGARHKNIGSLAGAGAVFLFRQGPCQ